ncbi:hypothetical protein CW705_09905 [Candidatus Bathyarchaeota archaeon]|nr:MAG: hypothetical protein CW705_09905 [Candidatus Bathyarchaeota archaeon]
MTGQIFFGDYILSIVLTALAIISGLTVKLLMPPLKVGMRRTAIYDELIIDRVDADSKKTPAHFH